MGKALEILLGLLLGSAALVLYIVDPFLYVVIAVHIFAIPALAYPLVYRKSPWKSGPTGKALMHKARAVAALFAIGIIGFWWTHPGYYHLYALVITYLGCAITYQFLRMLQLKKIARKTDEPGVQP